MRADPIGLYVHIPFCIKKCNYCDFCSFSDLNTDVRSAYISRLIDEIFGYKREDKIKIGTVFFGGGTPSLLSPSEFSRIADAIYSTFDIAEGSEFTIEVNPKTITPEKLSAYRAHGVNRISIGLQSIHENELKKLGRIHSFSDFQEAYELVRAEGINNVSVDIMYGIPEQTPESFKETLGAVLKMSPDHISCYGLILEENTPFWDMMDELPIPSEDEECEMYYAAADILSRSGYSHYEISNYAKPGFESKHNLKYWHAEEYIGVGISAYSYFCGKRYGNSRSMSEYLSDFSPKYDEEILGVKERAYEYAMLSLRLSSGVSLSKYKELFGFDFLSGREEEISRLINAGYLKNDNGRVFLTERGFYVSNAILAELL